MPSIKDKINLSDVQAILRGRGYAFHSQRGVALRLTKANPNKRFKETSKPYRDLMVAIRGSHLDEILAYSHNDKEAADLIEKLSTGAILAPSFPHRQGGSGIDPEMLEKLVSKRIEGEVAKLVSQSAAAQAEQQAKIAKLEAALAEAEAKAQTPAEPTKKVGAKKATRKQPKGGLVEKAKARAAKKADGPTKEEVEQRMKELEAAERAALKEAAEDE